MKPAALPPFFRLVLGSLPAVLAPGVTGAEVPPPPNRSMAQALADLKIPPVWLDDDALRSARLRDGAFVADASGYSDHIRATVTVRNTRIEEVKLEHQEKADLGARAILPRRLIEQQTVRVDGVTGATVTSEAIKDRRVSGTQEVGWSVRAVCVHARQCLGSLASVCS